MKIHIKANYATQQVDLNGAPLFPDRSLAVRNHSPDGFAWGYAGSGPSQLALAICLALFNDSTGYQEFKFRFIASLPQTDVDSTIDISDWLYKYHPIPGVERGGQLKAHDKFKK